MDAKAYGEMAAVEDRHWWFSGRRAVSEEVIRALGLESGARILEVGSGTGGNYEMLSKYGKVTAVEMEDAARQIAQEKYGIETMSGFLPNNLPELGENYDLICMFDVLEHVEQDAESLEVLRGLLAADGRILITVPAHQWLWSRHDVHLHHFRRYARPELRDKLTAAGLTVDKLTFTNMTMFPAAIAARVADRLLSSGENGASTGTDIPAEPVNSLIGAIYRSERHLVRRMNLPIGLGLLAVARKSLNG
ncbi:MAG: class I SAM-dependent methyltransferase [Pseudomonadota bacterium]